METEMVCIRMWIQEGIASEWDRKLLMLPEMLVPMLITVRSCHLCPPADPALISNSKTSPLDLMFT